VTLSSNPTGGSGIYVSYAWSGPNGFSSSNQNPGAVVPPSIGINVYTLTVTDSLGITGTTNVSATVTPSILANPNATPSTVTPGSGTTLACSPTGGSGSYSAFAWSGPGGFTSTLQNPGAVTPPNFGNNVYTLTVTDSTGQMSTMNVIVLVSNSAPGGGSGGSGSSAIVVSASATQAAITLGRSINLLGNASGGTGTYNTYAWIGPNGFTSSQRNPGPITPDLGTNVYTLTVTDSAGTQGSGSVAVTVNPNSPPAQISPPTAIPVTPGSNTINFTTLWSDPDNDSLTYQWDFGDGAATSPQITSSSSHTYAANGIYSVTLYVSDGISNLSSSISVVVSSASSITTGAKAFNVVQKKVRLTFKPGKSLTQQLVLKGDLMLAPGLQSNQPLHVQIDIGSISTGDMVVSSSGRYSGGANTRFSLAIKSKHGQILPVQTNFALTIQASSLDAAFESTGFVNANAQITVPTPATIKIGTQTFQATLNFRYIAVENVIGVGN